MSDDHQHPPTNHHSDPLIHSTFSNYKHETSAHDHAHHDDHTHSHTEHTATEHTTRVNTKHSHDEHGDTHDHHTTDHARDSHARRVQATHAHEDTHAHRHTHEASGLLGHLPFFHGHSHGESHVDQAMESSTEGIQTLKLSLAGLGVTAIFQLIIALASGSVGLLADTIHNATDALTALPLWIAFALSNRPPTRRYTYGYGRAEDVAGVLIVVMIALSAILAAYESLHKLLNPQPLHAVGWVAAAAIVGFIGNEVVAELRLRTGRKIGSAALEADGQHARVDGLTSLAVLVGAIGAALGFQQADPIIGLLITIAILFIVRDTAQTMWHRLMDAVDPELVSDIETTVRGVPGVIELTEVRARHVGHRIYADLRISVDGTMTTAAGHRIGEDVHHALLHNIDRLSEAHVHIDPADDRTAHDLSRHHARSYH